MPTYVDKFTIFGTTVIARTFAPTRGRLQATPWGCAPPARTLQCRRPQKWALEHIPRTVQNTCGADRTAKQALVIACPVQNVGRGHGVLRISGSLRQPAESKLGDVSECIYGGPSLVETRLTCTWTRLHLASFSYAKSIPT
ncbi:unnamed protein product [Durusdinium trenchii]|uniref:Uncharacterized protein n=2 Tax=Durusdinium trenchii TaxID=1381693 RepID=A0ABP0LD20_9DINO